MDENVCDSIEITSSETEEPEVALLKTENEDQQQIAAENNQPTQVDRSTVEPIQVFSTEPEISSLCDNSTPCMKQLKTPTPQEESEAVQGEDEEILKSAHEMLVKNEQNSYFSRMDKSPYESMEVEVEGAVSPSKDQVNKQKLDTFQLQALHVKEEPIPEENDSGEIDEECETKPEQIEAGVKLKQSAMETKKPDDEGEIVSDQEDALPSNTVTDAEKKKTGRKRKRSKSGEENEEPRSKTSNTILEEAGQSPRNRKTALEQLRSMKFSKKDPFNDSREHRTYRFTRDISPIRNRPLNSDTDRGRRSGGSDRRAAGNKSTARNFNNNEAANGENSLTEEQRRQRSTMFLLQNEQQLHQQHTQVPAILQKSAGVGPLKQRIENLLALPDDQVFNLPHQELKVLLIHAVELSQEQNRLLNGRKAQLIELDQMIKKEKDLIERISQDLPPQYRPNLSDELVLPKGSPPPHGSYNAKNNGSSMANGSFQQVVPQKLPADFSMPPPIFKELITPLANSHHGYPSLPFQPHQLPPPLPQPAIPSDQPNSSSFPLANMGVPPPMAQQSAPSATLFSQPPPIIPSSISAAPNSSSTYSMATHTITNTSIPPPTATFVSTPQITPSLVSVSMASSTFNPSQPPPNIANINFSIPPPSTQCDKTQMEKSLSTSSLTSLNKFNVPPPQLKTSGHPPFSIPPPSKPSIDVSIPPPTIGLGVMSAQPNVSTTSVNLTQPPSIQHQKPPPNFSQSMLNQNQAQLQSQLQLQQQIQALLPPDMTSVPPPNLALQLATAPLSLLSKQQGTNNNPSGGSNNNNSNRGTATPPRPGGPPRPLMSIDQPPPPGLMERIAAGNGGLGGLVPGQPAPAQQNKKTPTTPAGNRNQQRQQQHQQQKLRQARQAQFNKPRSRNHSPAVVSGANAIPVCGDGGLRRERSPFVENATSKSDFTPFAFSSAGSMPSKKSDSVISNAGSFSPLSAATAGESCLMTGAALQIHVQNTNEGEDSRLQNISPAGNE